MSAAATLKLLASRIDAQGGARGGARGGDPLARSFAYPLPIFMGRRTALAHTAADVEGLWRNLRVLARAGGYRRLVPRIVASELPRDGRFRLWVDWTGEGERDAMPLFRTILFAESTRDAQVIQMVEVRVLSRRPGRRGRRAA